MALTATAARFVKVLLEEGRPASSIKESLQRTFKVSEQEADEAILSELEKSGKALPQEVVEAPTKASPETLIGPQAPGKTVQETAAATRRGEEKLRALKASQFPAEPEPAAPTAAPTPSPLASPTISSAIQAAQEPKVQPLPETKPALSLGQKVALGAGLAAPASQQLAPAAPVAEPVTEAPEAAQKPQLAAQDQTKETIKFNEGTAGDLKKFVPSAVLGKSDFGAYRDSLGNITVGRGHLLSEAEYNSNKDYWDNLSKEDADKLFDQDFTKAQQAAATAPNFDSLNDNQKAALTDFAFVIGPNWKQRFPKLTAAIQSGDNNAIATELRNSDYYKQVGSRAERVASAFGGPVAPPAQVADSVQQAASALTQLNAQFGAGKEINRKNLQEALINFSKAEDDIAKLYETIPLPEVKDIADARRQALEAYKQKADRNEWLGIIDRALMAIGQFASGQAALGTPFVGTYRPTPIDYEAKTQRALQEYKIETGILEAEKEESERTRAAKLKQIESLADRIRESRKTAVTLAEKEVDVQEAEAKEAQGKVKQILDLADKTEQRNLQNKKLEAAMAEAKKKQEQAQIKQDATSKENAKKAQQAVVKNQLSIVNEDIKKFTDILNAANSVSFASGVKEKEYTNQVADLATKLGVSPDSLLSGQPITSLGISPRAKEKGIIFDESDKDYLKSAIVPTLQSTAAQQLTALQQRQKQLQQSLGQLIEAPAAAAVAPAGQEQPKDVTVKPEAPRPAQAVTKEQIQQAINQGKYPGKSLDDMVTTFKKAGYTVED